MDIVSIIVLSYFALFTLFFCMGIIASIFIKTERPTRGVRITEEDFWDEIDGGTYVTMEDGSVRLDNNGKTKNVKGT